MLAHQSKARQNHTSPGIVEAAADHGGEFFLPETRRWFTFKPSQNQWGIHHGLPHEVDVLDGTRAARVLKTVAYVAIDEANDGTPVLQRWDIARFKAFRGGA